MRILGIATAVALLLAPTNLDAQTTKVTERSSTEAKLVSIDRGSRTVPTNSVTYYGRLLNRLDRVCHEPRHRIGDIVVKSTQILKSEKGVTLSIKEMLEAMDKSLPDGSERLNLKCAEVAAILVVSIDRP